MASLELQLERRREGHPGFERGLESRRRGLPVVGREGIVQAFTPVAGLGVEALYSGNVQDLKALFVRATPTLQLSLQHARVGADSGNLSPALEVLARRVLAQLGPA